MLFDEVGVKSIMPRRDGCMGSEDRLSRDINQCVVKGRAVIRHPLSHRLQGGKGTMAFIQVQDSRGDAHGLHRSITTDAQDQLLSDARPLVAAVQTAGQGTIFRSVSLDIAVQQVQLDTANIHPPDSRENRRLARLDLHHQGGPVIGHRRTNRQIFDLRIDIFFDLQAVVVQSLPEIALIVKQPHTDQRQSQPAGTLHVVP